jgi:hypothetical protein
VPGWEHVAALMWRETLLTSRNSRATTYRYVQMGVLAFMVATLFMRDHVADADSVRVRPAASVEAHAPSPGTLSGHACDARLRRMKHAAAVMYACSLRSRTSEAERACSDE